LPPKADLHVGLMGASLATGNRGVSALGAALAGLVSDAAPRATVSLLVGNRDGESCKAVVRGKPTSVPVVNYRLFPGGALQHQLWWILLLALTYRLVPLTVSRRVIERRNAWIRTVKNAWLVGDIRGGDSFSDIYGAKRFLFGCLPTFSVLLIRREIVLFPQTYGPFKSTLGRGLARVILKRASKVLARDAESARYVAELTNGRCSADICPDVAFALESVRPEKVVLEPPLAEGTAGVLVGLNVSGLLYHGGYTRANMFGLELDYPGFLTRLVTFLLEEPGVRVILVPHTFAPASSVESDPAACERLRARLPESLRSRVHIVSREYDQHEIKGVIGICDFFVGSRMHACIAALSQGIPTIGVAYSRKFRGVFGTVGMADWVIDGQSASIEVALATVRELFDQRAAVRERLVQAVREAQDVLEAAFGELVAAR
jgi:polysaccharide pyruvyl transferase WcaK-like protein